MFDRVLNTLLNFHIIWITPKSLTFIDFLSFWTEDFVINFTNFFWGNFDLVRTQIFRRTNISYPLMRTLTCAYQGVRNISFSKNFACVLNEWSLGCINTLTTRKLLFLCILSNISQQKSRTMFLVLTVNKVSYKRKLLSFLSDGVFTTEANDIQFCDPNFHRLKDYRLPKY